jgi:hypothetical protein
MPPDAAPIVVEIIVLAADTSSVPQIRLENSLLLKPIEIAWGNDICPLQPYFQGGKLMMMVMNSFIFSPYRMGLGKRTAPWSDASYPDTGK